MGVQRGSGRKGGSRSLYRDSEAYRDLIEQAPSLGDDVPELDHAQTADDQLRIYQQANEHMIRDGRA